MKKSLFLFLSLFSTIAFAQTSDTRYYRSRFLDEEVPQKKAKYSQTIEEANGVRTTTLTNLKKGQIESRIAWRGDEPVGKWIGLSGKGPEELDFGFDLRYGSRVCPNSEAMSGNVELFSNDESASYVAPILAYGDGTLMTFIRHKLRYPAKARRTGISGTVFLAFIVTAAGEVQDVVVTKGADIVLDKEAARLIRALKFSSPPMRNGKPTEICVQMPLKFLLQ
jgi:TonB family protein